MQRERKLKALRRSLGKEEILKADEAVFKCPRPGKHPNKPKLSVNLKTDRFHCWVCEWSGFNIIPILRLRGNSEDLAEYLDSIEKKNPQANTEAKKVYDEPKLPDHFISLSTESRSPFYGMAIRYLAERGVGTDDILRWKLGYCEDGDYKGRIIIPSFDEYGELNFCVGRAYYKNMLSYKHENISKDIIWNDYMIDWSRSIVVTEGPFDAFKVSDNVVALQGSILREGSKLFRKIVTEGVDVFFAMDSDALNKQFSIINMFVSYGINSHYIDLMGKKDVGEMTKEEFIVAKNNARHISSELDILRLKVFA